MMPIVEVNGAKLNYMQIKYKGVGVAEELVMVHGIAANMAFWLEDYARYFSQYFNVTLYDLRGHGRSDITDSGYLAAEMANDLKALLEALNIKKAHFITHSFGGSITLNLACSNPEIFSSLVLADTHISIGRKFENEEIFATRGAVAKVLEQWHINLDVRDPYFGCKLLTEIAKLRLSDVEMPKILFPWLDFIFNGNNKRTAERWVYLMQQTSAGHQIMSDDGLSAGKLSKINFPVLSIYGEKSPSIATGKYLNSLLANVMPVILKNAGHFFPRACPGLVLSHCNEFYKENYNGIVKINVANQNELLEEDLLEVVC